MSGAQFAQQIEFGALPPETVRQRSELVYHELLERSPHVDQGNFRRLAASDLELLFDLYDKRWFDGQFRPALGGCPLGFRLSRRMTSAGGQASRRVTRRGGVARVEYEIAVATTLLFQTFEGEHRPVTMSGIECRDRLQALQRVLEHEMTHLAELLIWNSSSCAGPRFQSIARRWFAHTDHRHQLITPRERAYTQFGIRTGDRVSFRFEGQLLIGRVNRITKRATVLVEQPEGQMYSDGRRYSKFYVPVGSLARLRRDD